MIKAVIFDFDGVISDSEPSHYEAFRQELAKLDVELSEAEYYAKYMGCTDEELFEAMQDQHGLELDAPKCVLRKGDIFEKLIRSKKHIIKGVEQFLELLRENSMRIGICSGASAVDIDIMLTDSDLRQYFEVIVSANDVSRGKPDPEGYTLALKKLNEIGSSDIKACECVVIEDSSWGLRAAIAAGMHTIAVTNGYSSEGVAIAEKVVANLSGLTMADLQSLTEGD